MVSRARLHTLNLAGLWKGSDMAKSLYRQRDERRLEDRLIVIDRRNGKAWLYGQTILLVSLLIIILWLLIA